MPQSLLSLYARPTVRYDELLSAGDKLRPHWQPLLDALGASTPEQMRARQQFIAERIRENGTTYNVYADPQGTDRPWTVDPLPFILPIEEWAQVEAAVAQRAHLLDRVLADLYGPQNLIRTGALPAALVYGHNGFLWPCLGTFPPSGHFLHVYAADLARSPDGRWWVIADRTQGPSGAGYALENRLIVSRLFPDQFRDQRVLHLADFFRHMQDSLARWAPVDAGETPFIVLLSPGPYNETYFEQSYLARYLGFPLVEGQDLTVRGNTVYVKTLAGLRRVHVILRRLDDDYADPLELRGESSLGVPGLVQAARSGRVLLANALGSGVLESAGLLAFLPKLAEHLLGEPLAMPAVATWWCGESPALDYVIEHLESLVIKPAYPSQRMEPVFGRDLSAAERDHWAERLRQRPHAYVGQEIVQLSQAPVLSGASPSLDRRLLARAIGVRVYAVATPEGWRVMPGGLTRVAGSGKVDILSMQRGGSSKDTWVLSDKPVSQFSLLKGVLGARDIVRAGPQIASRAVENLFWLGRYAERVENSARLLRFACERLNLEGESSLKQKGLAAEPSLLGTDEPGQLAAAIRYCELFWLLPPAKGRSVLRRLIEGVHDERNPGSLASTLRRTLWAATQVRDRLSLDHWHSLNRMHDILRRRQADANGTDPLADVSMASLPSTLDRLLLACVSLSGFAMDDMMRDAGWRFLVLGRRIERLQSRCQTVAHFLDGCSGQPSGIEALLQLADCAETYRQRYLRTPDILPTLDLVVFDADNPHSVIFQVDMLLRYLESLLGEFLRVSDADYGLSDFRDISNTLRAFPLEDLELGRKDCHPSEQACANCGGCTELAAQLRLLYAAAGALSNRIAERFFAHVAPTSRVLST
ncbi:circularly permuted type 2 ATP-grasp protein [Azoarcus sp. KH32C]|uniref:circularly permuted type 2 ATP-grasp protein n=1 Tax=Azoarcus sp. KH32C TaxID=748247 RepID=UPI0002386390|nr:circularly permuted type 2 ATP-grasp protein [Azoarcus sp. KH32C]BAL23579.1 hypothetical protein AZKH_1251 [Azoarcus sp. KH32C]